MKKNNITKGLTLSCFILLIGAFILYRTHTMEPSLPVKTQPALAAIPLEDTSKPVKTDTLRRSRDALRRVYMSSSKSIVLTEPRYKLDTFKRPGVADSTERRKLYMMSGSKSGRIVDPTTLRKLTDSVRSRKYDTVKQ